MDVKLLLYSILVFLPVDDPKNDLGFKTDNNDNKNPGNK
jgi:hypothetical protein